MKKFLAFILLSSLLTIAAVALAQAAPSTMPSPEPEARDLSSPAVPFHEEALPPTLV